MDLKQDVHDAFNRRVDEARARMVWSPRGLGNGYNDQPGRVFA
jgi:4-hydroxyacetophenone monooxygenase